jgi:hypothetical protein
MKRLENETSCKLCGHCFSNKYNLKRHLEENNCKKFNEMNLYEIYKKFSNKKNTTDKETQYNVTKNNISIQTENQMVNTSVQTENIDNIYKCNNELQLISKLKYNYLKVDDLKPYIENYKKNTNIIYLSKIIKSLICNEKYKCNHIIKYQSINPAKFVFINENANNQIEILNLKLTVTYVLNYIVQILKNMFDKFIEKMNQDEFWIDFYEDNLELLRNDINNEDNNNVEIALKNVLQNHILRNPIFKYKS